MPESATPTAQNLRRAAECSLPHIEAFFEGFQTFGEKSLAEARESAIAFCRAMASASEPPYWLTFLGPCATGKTMLARRITRFFSAHLDCLRDERFPKQITYRSGGMKGWERVVNDMICGDYTGLRDLGDDWFVCLDDIGAEYARHRDLSAAKLYGVLTAREKSFTVITANLTLEDVNTKLDARIASRLLRHGSVVIDIEAGDYNLRPAR